MNLRAAVRSQSMNTGRDQGHVPSSELLSVKGDRLSGEGVQAELSVDDVGEVPFERADRVSVALALRPAPLDVGARSRVAAHLYEGHGVDHPIESAVAASVEPVVLAGT